ncbi:putative glutathione S-transferase [Carex rostrata]
MPQEREKQMEETVKLLGTKGSPLSHRAEVALRLKEVKFEFLNEDLAHKSDMLLRYNPIHKKVPVLVHGEKPIAESLIVIEYVDEAFEGYNILPRDPYERAMARFWARFIDEKVIPAFWMSCWTDGETQKGFIAQSKETLTTLQRQLEGKRFFGGDSIGLVDLAGCMIAFWFAVLQEVAGINLLNEEDYPVLCRWAEDYCRVGAVSESLLDRNLLVAHFASKKERIFATKAPVYD